MAINDQCIPIGVRDVFFFCKRSCQKRLNARVVRHSRSEREREEERELYRTSLTRLFFYINVCISLREKMAFLSSFFSFFSFFFLHDGVNR